MPAMDGEPPDEKPKRLRRPRSATVVFGDRRVIMECSVCGMTLVMSPYDKICKLLDDCDPPRGKVCASCGCIGILRLSSRAKAILQEKMGQKGRGNESL